jgi:hypothetical protein
MTPSPWRAERNERSLARLNRALPDIFPAPVLIHALALPLIPPTPRRAVESYWRHHVLRADRLARALAARTDTPAGWTWRLGAAKTDGLPASFRIPPAPFREAAFARGPGFCCVCGQPVFRFGWHVDLWGRGESNRNASWHSACVAAWKLWTAPADAVRPLKAAQGRRCRLTGKRLLRTAEVDHGTPLYRVWREHRHAPWPELLRFWGAPNLQVVNRSAHAEKCAAEAGERARAAGAPPAEPACGGRARSKRARPHP